MKLALLIKDFRKGLSLDDPFIKMNNNKIYTILSIFGLADLFLVVFFIWIPLKEIEKNSEDLISARNSTVVLSAQRNAEEDFENNYASYKPEFEKIDQLFIDPNNPVDFIEFLENTASDSQITSQISLPSSTSDYSKAAQNFINFQFSSKGGFPELLNFIKKIEAGPYLIEIENLTIQSSQDNDSSKKSSYKEFDATFSIKVFTKTY